MHHGDAVGVGGGPRPDDLVRGEVGTLALRAREAVDLVGQLLGTDESRRARRRVRVGAQLPEGGEVVARDPLGGLGVQVARAGGRPAAGRPRDGRPGTRCRPRGGRRPRRRAPGRSRARARPGRVAPGPGRPPRRRGPRPSAWSAPRPPPRPGPATTRRPCRGGTGSVRLGDRDPGEDLGLGGERREDPGVRREQQGLGTDAEGVRPARTPRRPARPARRRWSRRLRRRTSRGCGSTAARRWRRSPGRHASGCRR